MKTVERISNKDHTSTSHLSDQPLQTFSLAPDLFEAQAKRAPERVAIVHGNDALSYDTLNEQVNRLAHYLITRGIGPEDVVGICMPRSPEMIIALLSVLKAGAAYLPLDPDYPPLRLKYVLEDAAFACVITTSAVASKLPIDESLKVVFDAASTVSSLASCSTANPVDADRTAPLGTKNAAYIIYTSGSTGAAKGVVVTHENVTRLFSACDELFSFAETDCWTLFHSIAFDFSVWELLGSLLFGRRLLVVTSAVSRSPAEFLDLVSREGVTILNLIPTMFYELARVIGEHPKLARSLVLRYVIFGGEALDVARVREWQQHVDQKSALVNMYGITETTVHVTFMALRNRGDRALEGSPIGRALADLHVYVLRNLEPAQVGVGGELYVGGAGLARGYFNRPALTASRFVADPYGLPGTRMYRTGDLARRLPDGNLEFMGRADDQVKIRGFRIEPGEIEAALLGHAAVRQAVVIAREDTPGDKRLAAYYTVAVEQAAPGVEELRNHLLGKLPEHMAPAAYVVLENLPLTPNGKLDRKALPKPGAEAYARQEYEAPQTPTEQMVAEIWAEVVKLEKVGRRDNFFELGGHSLLAMRVIARVREALRVEMTIRDLFDHPVLAELAQELESAGRAELAPIERAERGERLPLSFAQQRLWFLAQMEGVSEAYHIGFGLRLQGGLDGGALRRALDRIVWRHEALRTTFGFVEGEPVQRIAAEEESRFALREYNLGEEGEASQELDRLIREEAWESFDLEKGPLLRGRLIRVREGEHVLLVTMHHIVSDGWSMGVFTRELSALYGAYKRGEGDPLPGLKLQYADYAVWQRKWIEGEVLERQAEYWKTTLEGAPAVLELPGDHVRPGKQDFAGDWAGVALDEKLTAALKELSKRHGTTLYMTLLGGWAALLSRLSGQEEVVIGTPVANRGRLETENLIGFFVNTLAMRMDVSGSPRAGELLRRVKGLALAAQQHQDIPFEQVVELARPARSLGHNPVFQVMFAWQNAPEGRLQLPGLEIGWYGGEPHTVAKFDLSMSLQEVGGRITGGVEYATSLFERRTIERYLGYFGRLLEGMAGGESEVVDRLPILPEEERRKVLYEWNETAIEYPKDKCVHELFEEQVGKTPEAVAVVYEEASLTYGELNRRANQLGHYLRELGVRPDTRVAICVERGLEMVVALLGVLKAGGAYVPLDPAYPEERLRYMLEDSEPLALLTEGHLQGLFGGAVGDLPVIDMMEAFGWSGRSEGNPDRATVGLALQHLAYVIYTSGSTGAPKGVAVEHSSLNNTLLATSQKLQLSSEDRTAFVSGQAFDISLWELLTVLTRGGIVEVWKRDQALDVHTLKVSLERITALHAVPALMREIVSAVLEHAAAPTLRVALTGGDIVSRDLTEGMRQAFGRASVRILYGPTETAILATSFDCEDDTDESKTPPIGRPIANTRIYILDAHQQPVPVGVAGELYIGGTGVARGYLKQPELTAEKFVKDPFVCEPGARMYRTGDVGRWLAGGNIEFLGRNDFQLKIRGFRIELGEIETVLSEHTGVREAVVIAREDTPGDKRLVAYYVAGNQDANVDLWPSIGEYPVYDEFIYYGLTHDQRRKEIYQAAFDVLVSGKIVLDVGTGADAILARQCIEAGARRVYAVEISPAAVDAASALIRAKELEKKIVIVEGDIRTIRLPEKVDVIVAEVFESIAGAEGAAVLLNSARQWLGSTGRVIPQKAATRIAALTLPAEIKNTLAFSETSGHYVDRIFQGYGCNFDIRLCIRNLSATNLISTASNFEVLDFDGGCQVESRQEIQLEIERDAILDGFALWLVMTMGNGTTLDIMAEKSAWFPALFPVFYPGIAVAQGDRIEAQCRVAVGMDGLHPDYEISGRLLSRTSGTQAFNFRSSYQPQGFRQTKFYQELFRDKTIPIKQSVGATTANLRAHLASRLPEYMVPAAYVVLENLPLTPNGKLDRKALPEPEAEAYARRGYEAPQTATEQMVAEIWAEVLKLDKVGRHDNFFELGGHSLLVIAVVERMRRMGFRINAWALFARPGLAEFAAIVGDHREAAVELPGSGIPKVGTGELRI